MLKNNLKLIGKNQEDLKIISAYSQDSIVSIRDIVFLKKNRIFIMITNRFMWEVFQKKFERKNIKRIRSALKFEEVLKVRSKKINQKNKNRNLECLAIQCEEKLNNNYATITTLVRFDWKKISNIDPNYNQKEYEKCFDWYESRLSCMNNTIIQKLRLSYRLNEIFEESSHPHLLRGKTHRGQIQVCHRTILLEQDPLCELYFLS